MQKLRIPRVGRAPKFTDFLEGTPREAELVVRDFRQFTPGDGAPVSQPTTAYLSYDEKNLYVAYVCKDAPQSIRARLAKHDQIMADDRVTLNIDTFHDHRHMYWFDINPYGVQADGNVTDGFEDDPSWDTLWRSEGTITKDGYTVLAAIPFKSLRFSGEEEQTWGLILGRFIQRNNEFSVWPYMSNRKTGWVQQGGDLEGLHDLSPGRNIQLIPYGLFSRARFLDSPAGGAERMARESDARVGLDSKIVLKDAFTLDVALNPDFSQVESDEPQVTVNQRYEVYYPEKRPFFLENARFFGTPERLFFSRRIIDPLFGARVTGKVGKWSVGALFADDKAPGANRLSDDPLSGDHGAAAVARVQREFGGRARNSSVGAMVTSDDFGSSYNRVYSVDARLQLLPNWLFSGQAMASNTRRLDGTRLAGPAYYARFAHQGRHFISETRYTDHSPAFRADLGYFQRLDIREASQTTGYMWRPEGGLVQRLGPVFYATLNYNREGRIRDWQVCPEFQLSMTRDTLVTVQRIETFELYGGNGFRRHSSVAGFRSTWLNWLTVDGSYGRGTAINYNPAAGRTSFLGSMSQANAGVLLRLGPHVETEERYIYNGLYANGTATIFNNHVLRSKVNYQLTRDLSLRFIADYNSVLPNPALTSLEKDKRVGLDLLFTYMLNPGTALYAGYTDLYQNYRLDPTLSPALYRTSGPDLNTGRQVFLKLSYLLRF